MRGFNGGKSYGIFQKVDYDKIPYDYKIEIKEEIDGWYVVPIRSIYFYNAKYHFNGSTYTNNVYGIFTSRRECKEHIINTLRGC